MLSGILIIIVFGIMALLMATKKLPNLFALPLMAIAVAIVAGYPLMGEEGILEYVIVSGTTYLAETMLLILLACWLSRIMSKTGVTQTVIKKAAELGGDKPIVVAFALLAVTAFLFTTLYGTGAAMLVSGIVLPILLSVGVPPVAAANLFLLAFGIGYSLNTVNMSEVTVVAGIEYSDLFMPAVVLAVCAALLIIGYLILLFRKGARRVAFAAPVNDEEIEQEIPPVKGMRGLLACLTPLLIVLLTLVFKVPAMACFYIGIVWLALMTFRGSFKKYANMMVSAFAEAGKDAAPAIGLCIGIGMALRALGGDIAVKAIGPFVNAITPSNVVILVIGACILAPLVLYRGPLNSYGLGAGLLVSMIAVGRFSPVVLGTVFYALCRWANDGCPTSTVVVYTSNYIGSDSVTVTNKMFFARWILTAVTIVAIAAFGFGM